MDIASSIKKYKNSVTRKYISLSNDEIDVVVKGDYWFSRKYDGQLWFYCKSNKNSKIINSNENDISTLTSEIKKELDKKLSKAKNIILAGELYFLTKERERYGNTISGLGDKSKRKNLQEKISSPFPFLLLQCFYQVVILLLSQSLILRKSAQIKKKLNLFLLIVKK